ncbi:MAG: hypothetical protein FH758_08615 [Firmicutes bacterium]|nr:hypothetical protein [Bacillota bacterium]
MPNWKMSLCTITTTGDKMINMPLFKTMFRKQLPIFLAYSLALMAYTWLLMWIFPTIAGNESMEDLLKSMPQPMLKMFNLDEGAFSNFNNYMATEFYSLIWILALSVFVVTTAISLIARIVDNKSIGSLLASPLSRMQILATQVAVLLSGLLIVVTVSIFSVFIGSLIWDIKIDFGRYVNLGLLGMLFYTAISSYCVFFSTLFNEAKKATGWAGGLTFVFYSFNLVSNLTDKTEWLQNLTLFSLFKPLDILNNNNTAAEAAVLAVVTIIVMTAAFRVFIHKDFPV